MLNTDEQGSHLGASRTLFIGLRLFEFHCEFQIRSDLMMMGGLTNPIRIERDFGLIQRGNRMFRFADGQ